MLSQTMNEILEDSIEKIFNSFREYNHWKNTRKEDECHLCGRVEGCNKMSFSYHETYLYDINTCSCIHLKNFFLIGDCWVPRYSCLCKCEFCLDHSKLVILLEEAGFYDQLPKREESDESA